MVCSCRQVAVQDLSNAHIVLLGGPKYNSVTSRLNTEPDKNIMPVRFDQATHHPRTEDPGDSQILIDRTLDELRLEPTDDLDYGLFLRTRNPWSTDNRRLVLIAGCHRHAQWGLRNWITNNDHVRSFVEACGETDPAYIVLGQYHHGEDIVTDRQHREVQRVLRGNRWIDVP